MICKWKKQVKTKEADSTNYEQASFISHSLRVTLYTKLVEYK